MRWFVISVFAAAVWACGISEDASAQALNPEAVVAGFEQRVDAVFRAEAGKPLVADKISKGRASSRNYSKSIMAFAARCFYLNEQIDEANAALAENAQYYLDHPRDIYNKDTFHWHSDALLRLLDMYGTNGSAKPGLIKPKTEALALKPIWMHVKKLSTLKKADATKVWHVYESENHHAQMFTTYWHFSKLAKDRPEYKDRKYDDGHTPAEHYRAWNDYFVKYCIERARKSVFIEMQSKYNASMLRPLFSFYDFGEPRVKQAAGMFLDLCWTYWAQEQIDGHVTGGGSRNKKFLAFVRRGDRGYFFFGIGAMPEKIHGHHVNFMLTSYRPPAVVADIAVDVQGRGRYEIRQRAQGMGKGSPGSGYSILTNRAGLLRYSYGDPAFIIGTAMTLARPANQWAAISTESRCHGAVLAGPEVARIVPAIRPKDNGRCFNAHWSVQSKGSLISQKLKYHRGAAESLVWLSKQGLSEPVEEDGVIFAEAQGAYAAVRVTRGGYTFSDQARYARKWRGFLPPEEGWLVVAKDDYAPVIVEIMAKTDIESFDAFKAKVKACKIGFDGPVLEYNTIYGDVLTLDTSCENLPTINGQPIDFKPKKVFDSPFLSADYDSGVVTIQKGERKRVLDFNQLGARN
jgi:hypothetical protein